jgi:hypothetical protein
MYLVLCAAGGTVYILDPVLQNNDEFWGPEECWGRHGRRVVNPPMCCSFAQRRPVVLQTRLLSRNRTLK